MNPGSTADHSQCCAACGSAFPFERQGRLLQSRSISGLFSRSLYSGLQPPCLRFAVGGQTGARTDILVISIFYLVQLGGTRTTDLQCTRFSGPPTPPGVCPRLAAPTN